MKKIILGLMMMFSVAQAGLLVEPYVGYAITGLESDNGGGGVPVEWAVKGQSFGFRGGWSMLGLFIAVDYEKGSRDFEVDAGTTTVTVSDMDLTNLGLAIGYDLPVIPLRIWGKMMTKSELKEDDKTWKGTGVGAGIGFTMLPFIDINIEVKKYNFDEGISPATKITGQEIMLGLSVPFTL